MKKIENYKIENKNVLFRADLNVPVVNNVITDESRILAVKSSITKLILNNNKIFIVAHFGRPQGDFSEKYSLKFILSSLVKIFELKKIHFLERIDNQLIKKKINEMKDGEVCLLENIRFYKEEEKIDLKFAKKLTALFDVYVNDAFSASHRNHTSITGLAKFIPAVAGDQFVKEIKNINVFLENSKKPNMAIIGGSKISTKIKLLNNLIEQFSAIVIGGAMANTFLLANNINVGNSLVEENLINEAVNIQSKAKKLNCKLILPIDVMCGKNIEDKNPINYNVNKVPSESMILDLGSVTIKIIYDQIINSKMVLWNGPLGAFEFKPYDEATNTIAKIIKSNTKKFNIDTLAGGGDTVSAINNINAQDGFNYISNAGGAFLEWLEGNESPGIIALKENNLF
jgi:phosphoglycerate kinase